MRRSICFFALYGNRPPPVNLAVATILIRFGDISGLPLIEKNLGHSTHLEGSSTSNTPSVLGSTQVTGFGYQMNLASCLSEIRNPAALPTLTRFMASTDPEIRRNAIQGVRNIKTPEAIDPLVAGLYDTDEEVRRSAVWGLVELLDNHKRAYDWEPPEHQSLSMQDDIDSLKAWAKQRQAGKLPP